MTSPMPPAAQQTTAPGTRKAGGVFAVGPRWWARDDGRVTAFVVTLMIAILAMAGLTLDGGLALAAAVRASGQAESAARAGAQAVDLTTYRTTGTVRLDPAQAHDLAARFLATTGATGTVTVTGDTVTVTVTTTQPTPLLRLAGISALTVHGTGRARPETGVTAPGP